MEFGAVLAGVTAIITAAGGIFIVVHEFRRRERRQMQQQIDDMADELNSLQHDYLELRKFMLQISQLLLDNGIAAPEIPIPKHF